MTVNKMLPNYSLFPKLCIPFGNMVIMEGESKRPLDRLLNFFQKVFNKLFIK